MTKFTYFIGLLTLLSTSHAMACAKRISEEDQRAMQNLAAFLMEDSQPGKGSLWNRARFEKVLGESVRDADNLIVRHESLARYRRYTGIDVQINLEEDLPSYLGRLGIAPEELTFIDGGAHGDLYVHPKLKNLAIKVSSMVDSNIIATRPFGDRGRKIIDYKAYEQMLDEAAVTQKDIAEQFRDKMKKQRQTLPKFALRRAFDLIESNLICEEAKINYFDFARVHAIGNYFFVREFYPDSLLGPRGVHLASELLTRDGQLGLDAVNKSVDSVMGQFPVLGELFSSLVVRIPSFFVSQELYESTKDSPRRRLFVVFDLD